MPAEARRGSASDPYGLDRPDGWAVSVDDGRTSYVTPDDTARIDITEFPRHLQVYWWVDVYVRPDPDAEWRKVEAGTGDSYRTPEAAAAAAQRLVDDVRGGCSLADLPEASE